MSVWCVSECAVLSFSSSFFSFSRFFFFFFFFFFVFFLDSCLNRSLRAMCMISTQTSTCSSFVSVCVCVRTSFSDEAKHQTQPTHTCALCTVFPAPATCFSHAHTRTHTHTCTHAHTCTHTHTLFLLFFALKGKRTHLCPCGQSFEC